VPHGSRLVHIGGVAASLEQGEADGVPAGKESTAAKAVAVPGDPMAMAIVLDVKMVGLANASRGKIGHRG
jgi:hypothetical protein